MSGRGKVERGALKMDNVTGRAMNLYGRARKKARKDRCAVRIDAAIFER
jgi:hypothetical protein